MSLDTLVASDGKPSAGGPCLSRRARTDSGSPAESISPSTGIITNVAGSEGGRGRLMPGEVRGG
jgi:hypothetical protein